MLKLVSMEKEEEEDEDDDDIVILLICGMNAWSLHLYIPKLVISTSLYLQALLVAVIPRFPLSSIPISPKPR